MNKIKQYLISILLIISLVNNAYGFAGMTSNKSTEQPDLINITESDQDIVLVQHLIEVDAVQLRSQNKLYVRETLIFSNWGTMNFSGNLRTWVQDGVEEIRVGKIEMTMGAMPEPVVWKQNGNVVSWQDYLKSNDRLPPLYIVEYVLPAEPEGTISKTIQYSKIFLYPTLTKKPNNVVLKITKDKEESIAIKDEKRNSISATGNPREEDNSILYGWETPEFNEINVAISSSSVTPSGIAGYVILGLLIILVFSYPVIRKKNEKIRALEDKIRTSLKPKETVEEATCGEVVDETTGLQPEPVETVEEDTEFEGKTREELNALKDETLSKLSELNKEYESGNMLDEEYEELKKSNQEKIDKITRRIEKSG